MTSRIWKGKPIFNFFFFLQEANRLVKLKKMAVIWFLIWWYDTRRGKPRIAYDCAEYIVFLMDWAKLTTLIRWIMCNLFQVGLRAYSPIGKTCCSGPTCLQKLRLTKMRNLQHCNSYYIAWHIRSNMAISFS